MSIIDRWVVTRAVELLRERQQGGAPLPLLAVNLSGTSLNEQSFAEFVMQSVGESSIANALCFEITETAAVTSLSNAIYFMRELKGRGCKFSLDDFGSGLSSFMYLKTLPVDFLKIDGQFISHIAADAVDQHGRGHQQDWPGARHLDRGRMRRVRGRAGGVEAHRCGFRAGLFCRRPAADRATTLMTGEPPFTVGVEEEYLLVDLATRDVNENPPSRLLQACTERGGGHINPEFLRCQLEVSTRVCHSIAEMRDELTRLRGIIVETARGHGLAPIAASTHPFAAARRARCPRRRSSSSHWRVKCRPLPAA